MKDCSYCMTEFVIFQVSQPYSRTAFMLLLKIFNLVFTLIFLFLQILYNCTYVAFAILMQQFTFLSLPPPPIIILPKYLRVYSFTASTSFPFTTIYSILLVLILIALVLVLFTF
jgi:hypothetical protein